MTATHPFAQLKSIRLEKLAAEPLVGLRRKDYSEYYRIVDRVFAPVLLARDAGVGLIIRHDPSRFEGHGV